MREIKFRGCDRKSGAWRYGDIFDSGWLWGVDPETIDQYTGLKDADGKEIYEGDIVEFGYHGGRILAVVCYTAETAAFRAYRCSDMGDADSYILGHEFLENLVKIGNIHDNPELLRGENEENQP